MEQKKISSEIFLNYLIFIPAKKCIKYLVVVHGLIYGNLMEFRRKY